jgi:anti-sigma factor RsiW
MANTETTSSRKQGGSSFIPLAVALVAVAVFIGWLATREPEQAVAVEEPDAAADTTGGADEAGPPAVVDATALSGATGQQYVGQYVQLTRVEVMSPLGSRLFWIDAGGQPYLVHFTEGTVPQSGARVQVTGTVREKSDALLDEWVQSGILESEGHRLQAEFGSTYIQARRVQPAAS